MEAYSSFFIVRRKTYALVTVVSLVAATYIFWQKPTSSAPEYRDNKKLAPQKITATSRSRIFSLFGSVFFQNLIK